LLPFFEARFWSVLEIEFGYVFAEHESVIGIVLVLFGSGNNAQHPQRCLLGEVVLEQFGERTASEVGPQLADFVLFDAGSAAEFIQLVNAHVQRQ
jgi:hypothetical protein